MTSRVYTRKMDFSSSTRAEGFLNCWIVARAGSAARLVIVAAAASLVLSGLPNAYAVVITDNFNDLNDTANPTWTHLDGAVQSTGQTWDASTGQYHLTAQSNGVTPGLEGYGFVGSYLGATSFTDVRVSADIVEFPNVGDLGSNFAIMARDNGNNGPLLGDFENTFHAYGYEYQPSEGESSTPPFESGEMVLTIAWAGGVSDMGSQKVRLDNTKDYRFVLEVVGNTVHGQVFNLTDGGVMVAERFRDLVAEPVFLNHDNNPNTPPIQHIPYPNGYSGAYAYGYVLAGDADVTFDNFRTETAVAGDYDRNGVADGGDYAVWRKTVGQMGPIGNCEPNNHCSLNPTVFNNMQANGAVTASYTQTIDGADYNLWRQNFGKTTAGGSGVGSATGVPEPASATLVLFGLFSVCCSRYRAVRHR